MGGVVIRVDNPRVERSDDVTEKYIENIIPNLIIVNDAGLIELDKAVHRAWELIVSQSLTPGKTLAIHCHSFSK